jgi:hypothetical protein
VRLDSEELVSDQQQPLFDEAPPIDSRDKPEAKSSDAKAAVISGDTSSAPAAESSMRVVPSAAPQTGEAAGPELNREEEKQSQPKQRGRPKKSMP